jgi:hypothetical protein
LPEPLLRPHIRQLTRSVASNVARIGPILSIEIEILGGEQVDKALCQAVLEFYSAVGSFAARQGLAVSPL